MENIENKRRVRLARTHTYSNIVCVGAQKNECQNED